MRKTSKQRRTEKRAKEREMQTVSIPSIGAEGICYNPIFDLGKCGQVPVPKKCTAKACAPTTRNDDMYVSQDVTVNEKSTADRIRSYFLDRLQDIRRERDGELLIKFGIAQDPRPTTLKELVARMKSGDFTFMKGFEEDSDLGYSAPWNYIRWTKVEEDRKGYEKALEALESALETHSDSIWAELDASKYPEILAQFKKAKLH